MKRTVKILAVIGILSLTGLLAGAAFLTNGCLLSDTGVCTGQCPALVDKDGDGRCDREQATPTLESESTDAPTSGVTPSSDEQAETLDEPAATPDAITPVPTATPPATEASGTVACPFGQVNDPYPGQCKRYVDTNDNGICDLSEPGFGDAP